MAAHHRPNVRILIEPRFYYDVGMVDYFMNNVTNTDAVHPILVAFLHAIFPELPLSAFSRNASTNFYLIDSGQGYLTIDEIRVYFEKLREFNQEQHDKVIINTAIQERLTMETNLRFNFFGEFPQGLLNSDGESIESIHDITEELLADEEFQSKIIEKGTDFSHLNQLNNNAIENICFNYNLLLGANFTDSNIEGSEFIFANLIYANFTNSQMPQTSFEDADLRYANFSNVNSTDNNFQRAKLIHANLVGAKMNNLMGFQAEFQNSNCRGAVFRNGDFRWADFTGADLTDADFRGVDTNLSFTTFTGAILENTKFNGTNWESSTYDDNMTDADHDTEYNEDANDGNFVQPAAPMPSHQGPSTLLPSLAPLNPYTLINNSTFTYYDVIQLLNPKIKNIILPASKMEEHKWYRVSDMGDTPMNVWNDSGVLWKRDESNTLISPPKLDLEKSFKCLQVPPESMCEGFVYESTPDCMAVHELSAKLNLRQLMDNLSLIVGNEEIIKEIKKHYMPPTTNIVFLQSLMAMFNNTLLNLLNKHNADDGGEGWTNIYDSAEQRNLFVNHALYHQEEGLINHQFFDPIFNGNPIHLLYLILFLNTLPIQMRVYWAQNYIMQFITGYGQTLETFDPTQQMPPYNFIASCINGNFEKLLLSIGGAIAHFIDGNLIKETEEEKQEKLKEISKKNVEAEFETYYQTSEEPTVEGYEVYIFQKEITADFTEEKKAQYLSILSTDSALRSKLSCLVHRISGGGRRKINVRKYTIKKRNANKRTLSSSSLKNNKNNKLKKRGGKTKKQGYKKHTLKKYVKKI